MGLMKGLVRRGAAGTFYIRKRVPNDLRAHFGSDEKSFSLHTTDPVEALRVGGAALADLEDQFRRLRGHVPASPAPPARQAVNPDRAHEAIHRWRQKAIDAAYIEEFNGNHRPPAWFIGDELMARSRQRAALQRGAWDEIDGFDAALVEAMHGEGIRLDLHHPAIRRLRDRFGEAWREVEDRRTDFERGQFGDWSVDETDDPRPTPKVQAATAAPSLKLRDLYNRYVIANRVKLAPRHKGYVDRLAEFLDDPDITMIEPFDLDRFKAALLSMPLTKKPSILALTFPEIVAWGEGEGASKPRIDPITAWHWINTYKGMFGFAVRSGWMTTNPADDTMPKPKKKRKPRVEFKADDIAVMFSRPMFTGFAGRANPGYRQTPGDQVVRDAKFWLPILGLFTGARLEEIGSTRVSEVRREGDIWFIDLVERGDDEDDIRTVKNANSRRRIPLHEKLIDLGFIEHVKSLPADGWLFPELTGREGKRTVYFGKWWGRWCERNAPVAGQGIDDSKKPFHSFRHTAIRALRKPGVHPALVKLVMGHEKGETDAIHDGYGAGADLAELKATIDQMDFPTFALMR
jgi:integrase